MVYKLTAPGKTVSRKAVLSLSLLYGILAWGLAVLIGALMNVDWGVIIVLSLLISVLTTLFMCSQLGKRFRTYHGQGDWFVTVTEAGLLLEKTAEGTTAYVNWEFIAKVMLRDNLLFLAQKNGMNHFLPLASLKPERAKELCDYCTEHAGKPVSPDKQVAPPADLLAAPALPCAAGVAARQETADEISCQQSSLARWVYLLVVAFMAGGIVVQSWTWIVTGEEQMIGLSIGVAMLFFWMRAFLHPGWALSRWVWHDIESTAHIHGGKLLAYTPGVAWSCLPLSLVTGAKLQRLSYVYVVQGGGVLGISRSVPAPAELPQPVPVKRWPARLALLGATVVVPVLVALGMWYWVTQMNQQAEDEACERGQALANYVQELLPPGEFPGPIYWAASYETPDGGAHLVFLWENDMVLQMQLPPSDADEGCSK